MNLHQSQTTSLTSDLPNVFRFETEHIPYQQEMLDTVYSFDYKRYGKLQMYVSGTIGSAKSAIAGYLGVRHCLEFPKSTLVLCRKSLPDIKDTIYKDIVGLLDCDDDEEFDLTEGKDYFLAETRGGVRFRNGSSIISRSWSDRKYKKLGSLKISAAIFEEMTENDDEDERALDFIRMRVGRLPHVPHSWLIGLTNPDEPDHWAYKKIFSQPESNTRKLWNVSLRDNPFLEDVYEVNQREDMDPQMAKRMLDGEWVSLKGKSIYRSYRKSEHYFEYEYEIEETLPIKLSFDFNVALNKPMSAVAAQYIKDHFYFFKEFVVDGIDTELMMEEIASSGFFDLEEQHYMIHGDATGKARSSKSLASDYDIIRNFLTRYRTPYGRVSFEIQVPRSNPPVKKRHNRMNAYLKNANKRRRVSIYNCKVLDEGLRLTKLKKGADYIEDDSKPYQHITTAMGYLICSTIDDKPPQHRSISR